MKAVLLCIGKTSYEPYREAIDRYAKRIPHYLPFEIKELPDVKAAKSMTQAQQKELEGALILQALLPSDFVVILDERGKEYTSRLFSKFISDKMTSLPGRLVFVIGGPYGFSDKVYDRADSKISLSQLTFPHEVAKLLFTEQLYRAMTILRGEPYHHD